MTMFNHPKPSDVPELGVVQSTTALPFTKYELRGWEELNKWGLLHNSVWKQCYHSIGQGAGLTEIERLQLLAGELLRHNVQLMNMALERAASTPSTIIIKPDA